MIHEICKICVGKDDKLICESFKSSRQCVSDTPNKRFKCFLCRKEIKMKHSGYISKRFGPICKKCNDKRIPLKKVISKDKNLKDSLNSLLKNIDKNAKK